MKLIIFLLLLLLLLPIPTLTLAQKSTDYLIAYEDTTKEGVFGMPLIGYKTVDGKIVIQAKYSSTNTDTLYCMAIVFDEKHHWVGIDRQEQVILYPFIYDNGPDYLVEGLFRYIDNEKIGFANLDGDIIIPAQFDFVEPFENGLAQYIMGGHREYVDGGEHWLWVGGYETGSVNKSGQRIKNE